MKRSGKKSDWFWDRIARLYDKQAQEDDAHARAVERCAMYLKADDTVLDYACGTGVVTYKIAADVKEVHAIAPSASAAQNFINRVEAWTDALFVGEPSSSSPNFVGEETNLLLPYSRIRGSISTRYWQDSSPGDERAWISPDIPVVLSSKDYFANRDPAMAALLELIPRRTE